MEKIIVTTTEIVSGREIEKVLGLVKGSTIRTRHVGSDIVASLRSLVGGEVRGYVKVFNDARMEATERMIGEAKALGADAIVCVRYSTASIMHSGAEMLAYGTAVKLKE